MIDHTAALSLALDHEVVPANQIVSGSPTTGIRALGFFDGKEYGVWEMSAGAMTDVEADEIFVVIAGSATLEFVEEERRVELGVGSVVQLHEGARTVWTVTERFRKVYVA